MAGDVARVGVIGGSGVVRTRRADKRALASGRDAVGRAVRRGPARQAVGSAHGVSSAPRTRPSAAAFRHCLPRQYRCAEARRLPRRYVHRRGRVAQARARAGDVRSGRSVDRSHPCAGEELLRPRAGGPRVDGASGLRRLRRPRLPPPARRRSMYSRPTSRAERGRGVGRDAPSAPARRAPYAGSDACATGWACRGRRPPTYRR